MNRQVAKRAIERQRVDIEENPRWKARDIKKTYEAREQWSGTNGKKT